MNKLIIIAAVAFAAAAPAFADDITPDTTASQVFSVTKTRAAVRQELEQARRDGSMSVWADDYNPLRSAVATTPRANATMHSPSAADSEFALALCGEDSGSFYMSRHEQHRSTFIRTAWAVSGSR